MKPEPKKFDDDDGRVIVNMNVEGMPWYNRRLRRERFAAPSVSQGDQLTDSEGRLYTWYSVLAGLFITLVFAATWVLFVLFCTEIWFK